MRFKVFVVMNVLVIGQNKTVKRWNINISLNVNAKQDEANVTETTVKFVKYGYRNRKRNHTSTELIHEAEPQAVLLSELR